MLYKEIIALTLIRADDALPKTIWLVLFLKDNDFMHVSKLADCPENVAVILIEDKVCGNQDINIQSVECY